MKKFFVTALCLGFAIAISFGMDILTGVSFRRALINLRNPFWVMDPFEYLLWFLLLFGIFWDQWFRLIKLVKKRLWNVFAKK